MNKTRCFRSLSLVIAGLSASLAHAEAWTDHLGGTVGGHYGLGTLSNPSIGLNSRSMGAFSTEGLVGYQFGKWLLGPDFTYRWVGQYTSLASAGGTNLRGNEWLLGVGAKYSFSPRWSIQGGLYFLGRYNLTRNTFASEDDWINKPLGVRLKLQYFFWDHLPLSADLGAAFTHYSKLTITSSDYSNASNFLLGTVGFTWHFGKRSEEALVAPVASEVTQYEESPQLVPTDLRQQEEELAKVVDVKRTSHGLMMNLKGELSFAPNESELRSAAIDRINRVGDILLKYPGQKVRVEGHTDASGNPSKNQRLSQARADAVKQALVKLGLNGSDITAQGYGQDRPIQSNSNAAGRTLNRRVEIYIEDTTSNASNAGQEAGTPQ